MKVGIPCVGAMSKSVKRFVKFTSQVFRSCLDEAERMMHVNVLL